MSEWNKVPNWMNNEWLRVRLKRMENVSKMKIRNEIKLNVKYHCRRLGIPEGT